MVTNTTPVAAFRGAGRPEAAAAIERAVDLFAAEIGLDPAEVRRRNFVGPERFPFRNATGTTYDSGDYATALERALAAAGYDELRAEQQRRRDAGDPVALGIGLSTYVEVTAGFAGKEFGEVEVLPDGSLLARSGTTPYGQGHGTTWAMLVSERTGVPIERIEVRFGDTDFVPEGAVTGGSRSVQIGGVAIDKAAVALVGAGRAARGRPARGGAGRRRARHGDGPLPRGRHAGGEPHVGRARRGRRRRRGRDVVRPGGVRARGGRRTFPFGAHVAVVEVDTETGRSRLVRLVGVDDAGRILNPLLAEGQVHGGMAQGIGAGAVRGDRLRRGRQPAHDELRRLRVRRPPPSCRRSSSWTMETPTHENPLGAKGIGESGTIGATPAVQNAVVDALAHLGVRHVDMPSTPERVWRAIQEAAAG